MRTVALVLASLFVAGHAFAIEDCPPGSVPKTEDGFAWCEPTVCTSDSMCKQPQEVCRPVPLCLEVGSVQGNAASDAGKRLVATKRCGPDKTCPQRETCSDLRRCIRVTDAEKMGLLDPAKPETKPETKKSSCGCEVIGARSSSTALPALLGLGLILRVRAGRRASLRQPR